MRPLVIVLVSLAWCASAAAQAPSDVRAARRLSDSGEAALRDGRFEAALSDFRASYELDRTPATLRRAGEAADLLRRDEEALATFEAYLRAGAEEEHERAVEARVAVLRAAIAERARARARALDDACAPLPGESDDADALGPPSRRVATTPDPAALALSIGGALVLAGGIAMVAVGEVDRARVEGAPMGTPWSSIADAAARAPVLDGVGGAALVLGAIAGAAGLAWAVAVPREVELVASAGGLGVRGRF